MTNICQRDEANIKTKIPQKIKSMASEKIKAGTFKDIYWEQNRSTMNI